MCVRVCVDVYVFIDNEFVCVGCCCVVVCCGVNESNKHDSVFAINGFKYGNALST